jgi:hypothetical protein
VIARVAPDHARDVVPAERGVATLATGESP